MSRFSERLKSKKFIITCELFPPKGTDLTNLLEKAERLKGIVDGVNVTDSQRAIMRISPLAVCHILKEKGLEPIFQLTCRDRNRIALQSDLLGASALGIENVLILSGDHPTIGDHPEAKPVYDLDPVQLLKTARTLEKGEDLAGRRLKGIPKFCLGAVANPSFEPLELQILMMEKKVRAGAEFFQTQPIFDLETFQNFKEKISKLGAKVIIGIFLLKSLKMAQLMDDIGLKIPKEYLKRLGKTEDPLKEGMNIAVDLIKNIKNECDGVHLMALGKEECIPEILRKAGLG
ncbi:methylenetetrahydrofolate reductase [bacterium]|nr:methylenetetrahydrofolate reductase [bacterium]MCG2676993.1 methylenetetrahydrofolate reductase [bacterium]